MTKPSIIDSDYELQNFLNKDAVKAFIGKNYEHFREIWINDYAKNKSRGIATARHLNWLALLAGPVTWFAYRKMYIMALTFTLCYCAATLFEYAISTPLPIAGFVGINVYFACVSKGMYYEHIRAFFSKNHNTSPNELEALITRHGGTSTIAAVVGTVLMFASIFVTTVISEVIFGPLPEAA